MTEAPILKPPDAKSQLIGKDPDCWERLKAKENIVHFLIMNFDVFHS